MSDLEEEHWRALSVFVWSGRWCSLRSTWSKLENVQDDVRFLLNRADQPEDSRQASDPRHALLCCSHHHHSVLDMCDIELVIICIICTINFIKIFYLYFLFNWMSVNHSLQALLLSLCFCATFRFVLLSRGEIVNKTLSDKFVMFVCCECESSSSNWAGGKKTHMVPQTPESSSLSSMLSSVAQHSNHRWSFISCVAL